MADVKAIELKGIVHNATKIGVQDGQAEDIVNLRFKDGSWRPTGDGKLLNVDVSGYTNIYIHTNVYRHMLGVKDGKLWWFATASEDDPNDFLPISVKEICDVVGDITITQTGHLITVIDKEDDFEYFLFKTSDDKYYEVNVDVNGKQSDKSLYPFGQVHFNCVNVDDVPDEVINSESHTIDKYIDVGTDPWNPLLSVAHDQMIIAFGEAADRNFFTDPFLAVAAIELYDGSYMYASAPVLIYPRQKAVNAGKFKDTDRNVEIVSEDAYYMGMVAFNPDHTTTNYNAIYAYKTTERGSSVIKYRGLDNNPVTIPTYGSGSSTSGRFHTWLYSSDLAFTMDDYDILANNRNLFSAVCIFITSPSRMFHMSVDGYKKSKDYTAETDHCIAFQGDLTVEHETIPWCTYFPPKRENDEIIYDLVHSPFFLLKRYDAAEIVDIKSNPVIDLSKAVDEGLLNSIYNGSRNTLSTESISRMSYLPKYAYSYNGRLHIADYESKQFHGYPIDAFTRNNHSVVFEEGGNYLGIDGLKEYHEQYLQYEKDTINLYSDSSLESAGAPIAMARVNIETNNGIQTVCRYIKAAPGETLEDFGPFISFPDYRAKSIGIYYLVNGPLQTGGHAYRLKGKVFDLKPHPYLNMAYYITEDLLPIKWSSFTYVTEDIHNGITN